MKIISNRIGTESYMYIGSISAGSCSSLAYLNDCKEHVIIKVGDIVQVEEFTTFCKVDSRKNCRGCAKLEGVTDPICFQYGSRYGLKEV